ncbi:MAG: hypothetical protein ACXVR9_04075 [Gaiellaceae bacterium]
MELARVIVVDVDSRSYPLTVAETLRVIETLREGNPHSPKMDDPSTAAAINLERQVEEPTGTTNPPMTSLEAGAVLIALLRLQLNEGLTPGMLALHDALVAYEMGQRGFGESGSL